MESCQKEKAQEGSRSKQRVILAPGKGRKPIIDSLDLFKLRKGLNYIDMLYYASIDTNYNVQEIKDSLANEKQTELRLLLGDLYLADGEYTESKEVFDSLKVYFREDKELIDLRAIQVNLFEDTLDYFDLDSTDIEDLQGIAFNDTSVAAVEAKAILELINDTIYPYPYEDKEGGGFKTSGTNAMQENAKEDTDKLLAETLFRLIPTLVQGDMIGFIEMGEESEGELWLYNTYGQLVRHYSLHQGKNAIQLNELNQTGVFFYTVKVQNEVKHRDKIIKIQ